MKGKLFQEQDNTECGVTSEANCRRQHAFIIDSAPADSGGIESTFVGWSKWKYYYIILLFNQNINVLRINKNN